ncbi:MAG: hypothetical protein CMH64_02580 [Nanoarchaeota archaeon]|nr:hypothetical protein [Nanoarchaeota archaeon]|tara:strand:- start:686 stop:1069 length:384 start_codon:yes stop_codon:yes gene_type:complete
MSNSTPEYLTNVFDFTSHPDEGTDYTSLRVELEAYLEKTPTAKPLDTLNKPYDVYYLRDKEGQGVTHSWMIGAVGLSYDRVEFEEEIEGNKKYRTTDLKVTIGSWNEEEFKEVNEGLGKILVDTSED